MSTVPAKRRRVDRLLLRDVSWKEYSRFLWAFASRRWIRLTYDRGVLEIMSPLWGHEEPTSALNSFVIILTEELHMPRRDGGSTTLRRRRRQRGLEPDRCWWIRSAPRLQGRTTLNLRTDPPPDLALETDVTSSSLDRMGIYATLGVREVWRVENGVLTFHVLDDATGTYQIQTHSFAFSMITPADLMAFLVQLGQIDDTALGLQFRAWLRQRLAGQANPPSQP